MKRFFVLTVTLALSASLWAIENDEILKKIEQMQQEIRQQQSEIQSMRRQLNENQGQLSRQIREEVDRAVDPSQRSSGGGIKLSDHISNLKIKGDLRLRYEARDVDKSTETTRDRFRTRLRLGGVWAAEEGWEIGVGVASGGSDATSTNDTWSDSGPFDTGDLRIDYAYAKHTWKGDDGKVAVILGQQSNPFVSSFLLWDGDVRPAGATVTGDMAGFFATMGAYKVLYASDNGDSNGDNASLVAAQLGWGGDLGKGMKAKVAAAYYYYDAQTSELLTPFSSEYDYHIGDLYGELSLKLDKATLSLFGDVWSNFGADGTASNVSGLTPEDEDLGWTAGIGAKVGSWSLGYAYGYVEADSAPPFLKDSDFGDTAGLYNTNVEGHKLSASYKLTKNFSLGATAMLLEQIEGENEANLYQMDAIYKF